MKTAQIEYPEDITFSLRLNEQEFINEMQVLAAVKFYELRKLSLGKAAELARMDKPDFIRLLGKYNITIFTVSPYELKQDIANA